MKKITYEVEGMTCDHCAMHVTKALESVGGVKSVDVSRKKNNVVLKIEETVEFEVLEAAVKAAGYVLKG